MGIRQPRTAIGWLHQLHKTTGHETVDSPSTTAMQAASAQVYRGLYLPLRDGHPLPLSSCYCFRLRYLVWLGEEPTHTEYELVALLLLPLPLLLILQNADDDPA